MQLPPAGSLAVQQLPVVHALEGSLDSPAGLTVIAVEHLLVAQWLYTQGPRLQGVSDIPDTTGSTVPI
jgi:hypothetical protein